MEEMTTMVNRLLLTEDMLRIATEALMLIATNADDGDMIAAIALRQIAIIGGQNGSEEVD